MPQRTCCISSCKSSLIEGGILHAFPNPATDCDRFRTWVRNAGIAGEDDVYVFKNRRICRLHFDNMYHYPKNRLSRLAIPTLHLPGELGNVAEPMPVDELQPQPLAYQKTSTSISECTSGDATKDKSQPRIFVVDDVQPSTIAVPEINTSKWHQAKSLTKTEIQLYNTIAKTQIKLKRCKQTKAGLIQKLKIANKFTHSEAYKLVTKNLSPAAKTFFAMQTRQSCKHPKGHRFTLDEKILALSLYKPSPKAYRLLSQICVLPKKSTLNKLMTKIYISPGVNDIIFENLKRRVSTLPNSHRYCSLIFDEMTIAANLSYDKHRDEIKGFCDDGNERQKKFADHVLVFMIRGIFKKYKQPIAYSFCAGSTKTDSLRKQLKTVVQKVLETGLKVVSTTCDQGSTNLAAINSLINETKADYLRQGKEYKGSFFEIEKQEIYPIYDPPHLLKGIRNNLMTKDLEYVMNGKKRTAKWAHLEALYKRGPCYKGVRMVPKLTARHVIPHLIPKMKVKYCTQVFSQTVSVAMGFTAGTGRIPRESRDTADLIMFWDKLFDSVNGSYSKPIRGKVYRSAVKPKSPHQKLWHESIPVLKSMRFVGGRAGVVPSISSWIKTIEAFQQLTRKLHRLGLTSLLLRNFNQDPLENFFGAIRAHGHSNIMPSSTAFETSYKALLLNNMVSPKSVGTNCEHDNSYCLQNLKYFLTENTPSPQKVKKTEIQYEHLLMELSGVKTILKSKNPLDIEKCAAAAYCSGWLLNLVQKLICKNCDICKKDLEGSEEEDFSKYIALKKYSNKCMLHYPNRQLLEYFVHVEEITIQILKTNCEATQIANYIELVTTSLVSLDLTCEVHKGKVSKFLLKKMIIFFINDYCKEICSILSGKSTVWDRNDPIKQMAYDHQIKNKNRKRRTVSGVIMNV